MAHSPLLLYLSVAGLAVTGLCLQDPHSVSTEISSGVLQVTTQALQEPWNPITTANICDVNFCWNDVNVKYDDGLLPALSTREYPALSAKLRTIPISSLQEDIEKFSEASSSFRPKRNAMERHRIYPVGDCVKCCGSGDKPDFTEETVKIYENCKAQLNESEEDTAAAACDIARCIGAEKRAVNADGYVIEDGFLKLIEEAYTDESLKDAASTAAPACVKKANEFANQIMDNGCNPAAILAYHCTKYEVILNCPEDQIVNSEKCRNFREMMQEWNNKQQEKPYA